MYCRGEGATVVSLYRRTAPADGCESAYAYVAFYIIMMDIDVLYVAFYIIMMDVDVSDRDDYHYSMYL
jgi:hypothetical protein